MKHLVLLFVFVLAVGLVAVAGVVARQHGYATPLGLPSQFSWAGRDYIEPTGCTKAYRRDLPLQRVGAVRGFLTSSKPIYLGRSLPRGVDPTYLYVSDGACLRAYGLSGGP